MPLSVLLLSDKTGQKPHDYSVTSKMVGWGMVLYFVGRKNYGCIYIRIYSKTVKTPLYNICIPIDFWFKTNNYKPKSENQNSNIFNYLLNLKY